MSDQQEPHAIKTLYFDPENHPTDTLKKFNDFVTVFELRYDALYPDPPKVSLDAALERWKIENATDANRDPKPTIQQYDNVRNEWRNRDRVAKLLGIFTSHRFYADWQAAEPDTDQRSKASWSTFLKAMRQFYKGSDNETVQNFHFRGILQNMDETFAGFTNRVKREAKHCAFNCDSQTCTAEATAIRDQIIIGTTNNSIREEALLKDWNLTDLCQKGMAMESASRGGSEIAGEAINKLGQYSYTNLRKHSNTAQPPAPGQTAPSRRPLTCFYCGTKFSTSIIRHRSRCPAKRTTCSKCSKTGHFSSMCQSSPALHTIESTEQEGDSHNDIHRINVFRVKSNNPKPKLLSNINNKNKFKVEVMVNNCLDALTADTGAGVSVCGTVEAKKWEILGKMAPSKMKIKPYMSIPLPVHGTAICSVTFGATTVPVQWHIISGSCEPILSGDKALQLGIITFKSTPDTFCPINMISKNLQGEDKDALQKILTEYPENFKGLGKLKHHQVKLHIDTSIKPVTVPPRPVAYHLKERVQKAVEEMIKQDVIEEHPTNEPAPWISCAVITPKPTGEIRVTLDARNVNKAIQSTNLPIPRHEDIKATLAHSKIFSKMDFKSAFWQLELHPDSRHLTVFHSNDKLYRYKRLTMGIKPAQGELNVALKPLFAHIPNTHLIHDDLIVAAKTQQEHDHAIQLVMQAISRSGLTLNPEKCHFGKREIEFWGMLIGADGVRPDPSKVEALEHLKAPTTKEQLISFLCMMQSNADFIPNFATKSTPLRELTKGRTRLEWKSEHKACFRQLLQAFRKDALLRFFDLNKPIYIFIDAHITGLGAMLAQGDSVITAKPVAFASRTTSSPESRYPQLDLKAMGLDFALRRFRNYLVGAPETINIVTDHKPLCSIFNGNRTGSIRTERIKLRHQDIRIRVFFQKGKDNQTDYMSRNATPLLTLPEEEQHEVDDLNTLLYTLHMTPIIDRITLANISVETSKDPVLKVLQQIIRKGQTWIPKDANEKLLKFKHILSEITITNNDILLKGERIILPDALHKIAIQLAHRGSHSGQSGLERRLRYHFFFHDMKNQVKQFVATCKDCQIFTDKKTSEPIKAHQVPTHCWEKVAVDLFGPMPSSHHVVVVQDLASRFPAAKIVSSTSASKVIPVLADIYDAYGNPETQLSDNGPPFNSQAMKEFTTERNINQQKIPPLHPSANPVETFMKPLGKSMKMSNYNKLSEQKALTQLISNYRDTPYPSTGIAPASMLFRDGHQTVFPRMKVSEEEIQKARQRDSTIKQEREKTINDSKYRHTSSIEVGDFVLMRNYTKTSKFHPMFLPEPCKVLQVNDHGRSLLLEKMTDGSLFKRHPDDVKSFPYQPENKSEDITNTSLTEEDMVCRWQNIGMQIAHRDLQESNQDPSKADVNNTVDEPNQFPEQAEQQRDVRIRRPNPKYFNKDLVC